MSRYCKLLLVLICFYMLFSSVSPYSLELEYSNYVNTGIEAIVLPEKAKSDFSRLLKIPETFWIQHHLLNTQMNGVMRNSLSEEIVSKSDKCVTDLDYTVSSVRQPWALQMLDSCGKIESGVLYGRMYFSGNYEECLNVTAPPGGNSTGFHGRFCWLVFTPMGAMPIYDAVCIPDSCNELQAAQYFSNFTAYLEKLPVVGKLLHLLNFQGVLCTSESAQWDKSAITYMFFLSLLVITVIIATLYELYSLRKSFQLFSISNEISSCNDSVCEEQDFRDVDLFEKNLPLIGISSPSVSKSSVLLCFSALRNGSKIIGTNQQEDQLDCLHGVRFLSMTWVILGHTYTSGIMQMENIVTFLQATKTLGFLTVMQGTFAVDSFFYLSGFLLAYLFLKDGVVQMGIRRWIYFYVHRYLRLTPTYALVIGLWASVWLYAGSGPFWSFDGSADQINCQKYWWKNLLYVNNFQNSTYECMGWSWYLANDMQFFVISPVFLVPLMKWPIIGVGITCSMLLASWITTGVISFNDRMIFWESDLDNFTEAATQQINFMDHIYIKPYTRIGPYLIGVLVAVAFLHYRRKPKAWNKWLMLFGWCCAISVTLLTVYGVHNSNMSVLTMAFYNALSRSAFALGLGWLTFACLIGYGGPINWILSWKMWFPLSRLTYCAYLLHPLIHTWYFGTLKHTFYFSHTTTVMIFLAVLVVSYSMSFVASLVIESPFISLEKHISHKVKQM